MAFAYRNVVLNNTMVYAYSIQPLYVIQKPDCEARVLGLKEGQQYQFRVRAVNKAGQGEPSDATGPHIAKARFRMNYIIYYVTNCPTMMSCFHS